jgi:hypothetical protein
MTITKNAAGFQKEGAHNLTCPNAIQTGNTVQATTIAHLAQVPQAVQVQPANTIALLVSTSVVLIAKTIITLVRLVEA